MRVDLNTDYCPSLQDSSTTLGGADTGSLHHLPRMERVYRHAVRGAADSMGSREGLATGVAQVSNMRAGSKEQSATRDGARLRDVLQHREASRAGRGAGVRLPPNDHGAAWATF